jgi:hypothetical protein
MAWGTHAERRADLRERAEKAEARAAEYRAREASCRTQGKPDKANGYATTAARQERIAEQHRRDIERLDQRAREQALAKMTAAERAMEMVRAQELAAAAAAALPAIDPLDAYSEALQTAAALEEDVARFEKNARAYSRAGDKSKAEISTGGAARARQQAVEWRAEAERVQAGTSRDLARELKMAIKAKRRRESQVKNEAKRRTDLGVVGDPMTAAGQREIASGGRGRGIAVASLRDYASLIRKPQERTRARLETMERFDDLCGTADSGLFPEPRFEHESGSGHGPGALVMAKRAAGLAEMGDITNALGANVVEMLRLWIYHRHTFVALVRAGYGTERTIGATTLAALDALATFFKTGSALAAARTGLGLPAPSQLSEGAWADQESPRRREASAETASSSATPARRIRPAEPQPWSNRLPQGDRPKRATIVSREPISDA